MKHRINRLLPLFFLCSALIFSACGSPSTSSDTSAILNEAAAYAPMESAAYPKQEMGEPAAVQAASGTSQSDSDSSGISDSSALSSDLPSGRKLIRNVRLSVETDEFDTFLEQLNDQVSQMGGYVEQSDISGNSMQQNRANPRYASLTIRIPVDQLDKFVQVIETRGNVTNRSENTQDVTLQYSDLESRKKSLTVEQDRLWALLEKADTLESVIALEERLSEIRYQLESMESQLRLYDNQVEYSTVSLALQEIVQDSEFTPTEPESFEQRIRKGLSRNLERLGEGGENFLISVITLSPFWLPLLAAAAIIFFIIRKGVSSKKKGSDKVSLKGEDPPSEKEKS